MVSKVGFQATDRRWCSLRFPNRAANTGSLGTLVSVFMNAISLDTGGANRGMLSDAPPHVGSLPSGANFGRGSWPGDAGSSQGISYDRNNQPHTRKSSPSSRIGMRCSRLVALQLRMTRTIRIRLWVDNTHFNSGCKAGYLMNVRLCDLKQSKSPWKGATWRLLEICAIVYLSAQKLML